MTPDIAVDPDPEKVSVRLPEPPLEIPPLNESVPESEKIVDEFASVTVPASALFPESLRSAPDEDMPEPDKESGSAPKFTPPERTREALESTRVEEVAEPSAPEFATTSRPPETTTLTG
jgi:hypothetical protein